MDMDMPVNVPVDNPNADTEWQAKRGSQKPPSPTPIIEEALVEARKLAHENRLEGKNIDELDELEDEEDEGFLEQYQKKRINELSAISQTSIYNQVYPLQKAEYSQQVTDVSHKSFVLVLLTSSVGNNTESVLLSRLWSELASKFGDVKFCQMRADLCIEGYPDRNTPTVLVYKDGDIKKQIVTLKDLNGTRANAEDVEKLLVDVGAVKQNDPRLHREKAPIEENATGIRQGRNGPAVDEDDDSDWD
ncbi:MAG: hypothetical protein M1831_004484 [Alyxoria varia]|nr:MAG: hypothetical protein M1831_004484 [Alyxoria varia]